MTRAVERSTPAAQQTSQNLDNTGQFIALNENKYSFYAALYGTTSLTLAIFYKAILPIWRANPELLSPLQHQLLRNFFDYIGNNYNGLLMGIVMMTLDSSFSLVEDKILHKELKSLAETVRRFAPIILMTLFTLINIDTESFQIVHSLLAQYAPIFLRIYEAGIPQLEDILAGQLGLLAGVLLYVSVKRRKKKATYSLLNKDR
jgi:hypothetical protein